jgi:hypothetical protein
MDAYFTLCKKDIPARYLTYRLPDGQNALVLFKSEESAQDFIDGTGHTNEYQVLSLNPGSCAQWLLKAFEHNIATAVARDPAPQQVDSVHITSTDTVRIVTFAFEILKDQGAL